MGLPVIPSILNDFDLLWCCPKILLDSLVPDRPMLLQHVGHVKGDVAMNEVRTRLSKVVCFQESQQSEDLGDDHRVGDISAERREGGREEG